MIPKIGQEVTIRARNPMSAYRHLYANGVIPEFLTFTGKVSPTEKWQDPKKTLNLTTGIRTFPIRSISVDDIVSINGFVHEVKKTQSVPKNWTVTGSKGDVYTVTEVNGHRSCTCVGFSFRRSCRHIVKE